MILAASMSMHICSADMAICCCSDVTWIIRNNELGGQIAANQQPLALASATLENFAPTGAENVPNAPLFVPYRYMLFTKASITLHCHVFSTACHLLSLNASA